MGLSAWLLVAVIFILSGLVVYLYRHLTRVESEMASLGSTVAFNIVDKNKTMKVLREEVESMRADLKSYIVKITDDLASLRLGLEATHNKASTADYVAHSAKQEIMRMSSMRVIHVHKHIISKKKKRKIVVDPPMDEATKKVLNRVSLQMNELNQ